MAQKVQAVPNPRFTVKPLTTVAGTIVSRRRIKVPVTNTQPLFSGQRNSNYFTTQNFAYWDIADNESFLDLSKMIIVMDLTFHCYQALAPSFDQSSQSLLWKVEIGTSQGLKIEEIQNYNQWAAAVSQYTESSTHKEMNYLERSDFNKSIPKHNGMNHLLDSSYYCYGSSAVTPEKPTRIHLRIHHSSFLNNVKLLPLFLFRNGIRIQVYFESVYKAFCLQHAPDPMEEERFSILNSGITNFASNPSAATALAHLDTAGYNKLNWYIALGPNGYDAIPGNPWTDKGFNQVAGTFASIGYPFPSIANPQLLITHYSTDGTLKSRPVHNMLMLKTTIYRKLIMNSADRSTPTDNTSKCIAFPVRFHHNGQLVWTGFAYQRVTRIPSIASQVIQYEGIDYSAPGNKGSVDDATATWRSLNNYSQAFAIRNNAGSFEQYPSPVDNTAGAATLADVAAYQTDYVAKNGQYIPFYLTSYIPESSLPYYTFTGYTAATPPNTLGANALTKAAIGNLIAAQAEMSINAKRIFYFNITIEASDPATGASPSLVSISPANCAASFVHPLLSIWLVGKNQSSNISPNANWTYDLKNLEMILDLVKPSAVDFQRFQQAYMSPSGIPYPYKRLIYRKTAFKYSSGVITINMQVSVRSMSGIMILLQDPKCDQEPQDSTKYMLPCLSSFFRKGLTRAEVVVGGQQYPVYQLYFKPNYSNISKYTDAHIPEVENFFATSDLNPSGHRFKYDYTRNYASCGLFDMAVDKWQTLYKSNEARINSGYGSQYVTGITATGTNEVLYSEPLPPAWTYPMLDASGFILAFSLQKDDMNGFSTGIDSSQSGAVNLNLYFQDSNYDGNYFNENIDCHTFVVADAVFTKQNDADLVRY